MSKGKVRLSQEAVDLLLTIVETASMAISGAALDGYYPAAGAELIEVGALEAEGFEPVAVRLIPLSQVSLACGWFAPHNGAWPGDTPP